MLLRISVLSAMAGAMLAGCTPMRWEHPQLGTTALEKDARECEVHSRREWIRYDRMYDLYGFCMRSKGYRQVPAK